MKPCLPALACGAALLVLLTSPQPATAAETVPVAGSAEPAPPAAATNDGQETAADDEASRRGADRAAFEATIVTGDRSRTFDSPARAMTELQRALGLQRRSGKEQAIAFKAVLVVNGEDFEFDNPDQARTAVRAVIDAVRRLARVRAGLGDLGTIPDLDPDDDQEDATRGDDGRPRANAQTAMLTIRQRVNEALREEVQRNQGRPLSPQRMHQIYAEEWHRARSEGLLAENAAAEGAAARLPAGGALEARKSAEIEAVRELLARAFSAATTADAPDGE